MKNFLIVKFYWKDWLGVCLYDDLKSWWTSCLFYRGFRLVLFVQLGLLQSLGMVVSYIQEAIFLEIQNWGSNAFWWRDFLSRAYIDQFVQTWFFLFLVFGSRCNRFMCYTMSGSGAVVGDDLPGRTVIGCNNIIGYHAVVGVKCQDMKYKVVGLFVLVLIDIC